MKKKGIAYIFKALAITTIVLFSLLGFFLSVAYLAVKLNLTNDPGFVDLNNRYFQDIVNRYGKNTEIRDTAFNFKEAELYHNLFVLCRYYPNNAENIYRAYINSRNLKEAFRMIEAVNLNMQGNEVYFKDINNFSNEAANGDSSIYYNRNVFSWMNSDEWQVFKDAVLKDKALIDSAAYLTGVEPRLIVSVLVGEQIRLFNTNREAFKRWISPLKVLLVETTYSLGVTGIKALTAQKIERNLKDTSSVFYLGKKYENLLDFRGQSVSEERLARLTDTKNHFYSYLYAALNIKQIKVQWEKAGFPIDDRPEILSTLFNIGFEQSVPKENPVVGGSGINIKDRKYSFGMVAFEFYYSGELFDQFSFKKSKFDFYDEAL